MANRKRATAPNVKVGGRYRDMRAEMLKELEDNDPANAYCYMSPDVSAVALERAGMELVRGEDKQPLRWREDVIARRPRADYDADREAQTAESADAVRDTYCRKPVDDVDKDGDEFWKQNSPGKRVAKAKDPSEIEDYGGV